MPNPEGRWSVNFYYHEEHDQHRPDFGHRAVYGTAGHRRRATFAEPGA